jgi:hypothetical protein
MSGFPKIESPCPLRWKSLPDATRNFCTHCSRQVHNLNDMSATQRRAFLASCSGTVCVAYIVPRRRSAGSIAAGLGLGLAAALGANAVAAGSPPPDTPATAEAPARPTPAPQTEPAAAATADVDDTQAAADTAETESIDIEGLMILGSISPVYEVWAEEPEWLAGDLPELLLPGDADTLRDPAEFVEPPELT